MLFQYNRCVDNETKPKGFSNYLRNTRTVFNIVQFLENAPKPETCKKESIAHTFKLHCRFWLQILVGSYQQR